MEKCDHTFIIKLFNTFQDTDRVYILSEICLGGELFRILRSKKCFSKKTAMFYAASVVLAFQHMHGMHILYRDLKPENLMLDNYGYLKVVDFGFAKVLPPGERTFTLCGTPDYLAPEIILNQGHDHAVDWWALGVLIYEMLVGYAPFTGDEPVKTYKRILEWRFTIPKNIPQNGCDIIKALLRFPEHKRLGCQKTGSNAVRNHIWFEGLDWDRLLERKLPPPHVPVLDGEEDLSNFPAYIRQITDEKETMEDSYTDETVMLEKFKDF